MTTSCCSAADVEGVSGGDGTAELANDGRYAARERLGGKNQDALNEIIAGWTRQRTAT